MKTAGQWQNEGGCGWIDKSIIIAIQDDALSTQLTENGKLAVINEQLQSRIQQLEGENAELRKESDKPLEDRYKITLAELRGQYGGLNKEELLLVIRDKDAAIKALLDDEEKLESENKRLTQDVIDIRHHLLMSREREAKHLAVIEKAKELLKPVAHLCLQTKDALAALDKP